VDAAMSALIIVLAAAGIVLASQLGLPWWHARKRERVSRRGLDRGARLSIEDEVPLYRRLPIEIKARLESLVAVFVAEKEFVGCAGLEISAAMKLSIATQACLLIVNRRKEHPGVYDELDSILVYPSSFVVHDREVDDAGIVTEEPRELLGQTFDTGRIILSWSDVESGSRTTADGANVVLHEFAHYLDNEDGSGNGAPILADSADYERWSTALKAAYGRAWHRIRGGRATVIDAYALENEAEFFAVVTEVFFESAAALKAEDPPLYGELARYYQLDPASWVI
jgi:hypothetical protein